jgi:ribonuclease HI
VATDSLATRKNKWRRTLEVNAQCLICGMADEDAFHATVACTKARALREAMRGPWNLPGEQLFRKTGTDWLQILLGQVDELTRSRILMLLWRAWHLRNDIIHDTGMESIEHSRAFLESYNSTKTLQLADQVDIKGKAPTIESSTTTMQTYKQRVVTPWSPPPDGWIKLNTDASFIGTERPGGAGAVARDPGGNVLLAACSPIVKCGSAEEAEAKAVLMGVRALTGLGHNKLILEMDCSSVAAALRTVGQDRSPLWHTYDQTKKILSESFEFRISLVRRESNRVADALANLARSAGSCIWTSMLPDRISDLVSQESTENVTHLI